MSDRRRMARKSGFTLIELLVVIMIIGVLAGLMLPAISLIQKAARKGAARTEISQLEVAFRGYYDIYEKWPTFVTDNGVAITANTGGKCLLGIDTATNPQGIQFMEFTHMKEGDSYEPITIWAARDGALENDSVKGRFHVAADTDFDNEIEVPNDSGAGTRVIRRPVAVWAYSADHQQGTEGYVVGSWQ